MTITYPEKAGELAGTEIFPEMMAAGLSAWFIPGVVFPPSATATSVAVSKPPPG